jgi:hypothetical protein
VLALPFSEEERLEIKSEKVKESKSEGVSFLKNKKEKFQHSYTLSLYHSVISLLSLEKGKQLKLGFVLKGAPVFCCPIFVAMRRGGFHESFHGEAVRYRPSASGRTFDGNADGVSRDSGPSPKGCRSQERHDRQDGLLPLTSSKDPLSHQ